MKKIYSYLTYGVMAIVTVAVIIVLVIINKADRADFPLDGLIAFNFFLTFVLVIVLLMSIKLKRVYLYKDHIVLRPLFSDSEKKSLLMKLWK